MPFRSPEDDTSEVPGSADPLARFLDLNDALEQRRGFFGDKVAQRFAAVSLLTTPGPADRLAEALLEREAELRKRLGRLGSIGPSLRLLLAANLVKYGDDAHAYVDETERARSMMRKVRLRRSGSYEYLAALVLRRIRKGSPTALADIERLEDIYQQMKRHHWVLTGPEDLPVFAMLVPRPESAADIADGVEAMYQALHRDARLYRGEALQTAASVLFTTGLEPAEAASRFRLLRESFRTAGHRLGQAEYDELATLCFLAQPVDVIVDSVLGHRDRLRERISWLSKPMAFGLGAGVAFVRLAGRDAQLGPLADAKLLLDMQAVIAARTAAAAAAGAAPSSG
jgi:hypothetical protein